MASFAVTVAACVRRGQVAKPAFWNTTDFYGMNLSHLASDARADYFSQPVVGYFDTSILLCTDTVTHVINFQTDTVRDLAEITVPLHFVIQKTGGSTTSACVCVRLCWFLGWPVGLLADCVGSIGWLVLVSVNRHRVVSCVTTCGTACNHVWFVCCCRADARPCRMVRRVVRRRG